MTTDRALDELTADDFLAVRGGQFRVAAAELDLELTDVTEYAGGQPGSSRIPFSVLFCGPLSPMLPQATYRLENDGLGKLDLFIVPLGPERDVMRYEAVFG
jgi:hypothetical protein